MPASASTVVDRVLRAAREHLGMEVAYVTEIRAQTQMVRIVDGDSEPLGFTEGTCIPLADTLCERMLSGRLSRTVPDTRADPVASEVSVVRDSLLAAYVGVPIMLSDGTLFGTLCCASAQPRELTGEVRRFLETLATIIAQEVEEQTLAERELSAARERIERILADGEPRIVLQPIVALDSGEVVGAEALSRFEGRLPEEVFEEARGAGLDVPLEGIALERALELRQHLPPGRYLSVNASPRFVRSARFAEVLESHASLDWLVVELTEHHAVDDYDALADALVGARARGARVAVDDVGAGFASFRHVLRLDPDIIKLDGSLTSLIGSDTRQEALAASVVAFAARLGVTLVAECVETPEALRALRLLGVQCGQGFLFARPGPPPLRLLEHPLGC